MRHRQKSQRQERERARERNPVACVSLLAAVHTHSRTFSLRKYLTENKFSLCFYFFIVHVYTYTHVRCENFKTHAHTHRCDCLAVTRWLHIFIIVCQRHSQYVTSPHLDNTLVEFSRSFVSGINNKYKKKSLFFLFFSLVSIRYLHEKKHHLYHNSCH